MVAIYNLIYQNKTYDDSYFQKNQSPAEKWCGYHDTEMKEIFLLNEIVSDHLSRRFILVLVAEIL